MKNIFRIVLIIILLIGAFFLFKNLNDKSKVEEIKEEIVAEGKNNAVESENLENVLIEKDKQIKPETDAIDNQILNLMEGDIHLGDKNADVTMIEYDSLTCPHCRVFYKTIFPTIEKEYIETGKLFYISRSFPTDGISFRFALMMECLNSVKDKLTMRKIIFDKQNIIFEKLGKLNFKDQSENNKKKIGDEVDKVMDEFLNEFSMAGLDKDALKTCGNPESSEERKQKLLNAIKLAHDSKYKIEATPTFIINATKHDGAQTVAFWKKIIDDELSLIATKKTEEKNKKLNLDKNNLDSSNSKTQTELPVPESEKQESNKNPSLENNQLSENESKKDQPNIGSQDKQHPENKSDSKSNSAISEDNIINSEAERKNDKLAKETSDLKEKISLEINKEPEFSEKDENDESTLDSEDEVASYLSEKSTE